MKKEYIIPETAVHSINIENLLITSGPIGDTEVDGGLSKEYDDEEGYWD